MHRDEDDDFFFEVVILGRLEQQRNVLDLRRRHRHMIVMLDARFDFECDLIIERILLDGARDFRVRDGFLVFEPLQERREVQAERIEEAVAIAAVQTFLHEERNLLRKIDERLIDDLQQPVARRERDAVALVVKLADVDIDVRRNDLLDEVVADALALQQLDLVLDDAVEVECLLVLRAVARTQAAASGRLDDERLREVLRELRQRLPVRRERQQAVLDRLRQHAEIDLDVLRVVDAVEERLRAEQLDVAFELPDVARADAADQALDGFDADADRLLDTLRLVRKQHLDDVELFAERARCQRRDRDDVWDAAHERLCQRRLRILRRRADDQHFRLARARRLAEAVVRARIHEVEDHLLPLRRQAVDLVEEQHAAVGLLDEAGLRLIRARERALDMAEDMREQQLRVVVVVRTVERHERRVVGKAPHRLAVGKHQVCEQRLADTRLADNQRVQSVGRIKNRRLRLLDLPFEAPMRADQRVKRLDFLLLNRKRPLAGI